MRFKDLTLPLVFIVCIVVAWYSELLTRPPKPDGPVHVSYWEKWTGFEGSAMRAVVDAFNASQADVHVDLLTVSNIERKTLFAISGGNPPDIAGLFGPNLAEYVDDNALRPLDSYCRQYSIQRSQYVPIFYDIGTYDGHVYSLPSTPACTALHYNKQMFRAAGLNAEHPPQTIEELDEAAAKITTRKPDGSIDHAGFLPADPGWWAWSWGYLFGGRLWDGKSRITANSPENVRAFAWIQSYSDRYGSKELSKFESGLGQFSSPQNPFLSNKVAMELQGVWMYNFIHQYSPQLEKPVLNWAAVPFPHPANRPDLANLTIADEDILVIPRGAQHPDAAFKFIAFVQSQKGMEMLCMGQKKESPLLSVTPAFYKQHPNPFIHLFADMPKSKNVISAPKIGIWPEYQDELKNAYDLIERKERTAQQALDYVQARMQPKWDQYLERLKSRRETARAEGALAKNHALSGAGQ